MNKKTIILVLIAVILFNTIYWLYITIRVFGYDSWLSTHRVERELLLYEEKKFPQKEMFDSLLKEKWRGFFTEVDVDKLTATQKKEYQNLQERIKKHQEKTERMMKGFTNRIIRTFAESNLYTIPLLILAIIDVVLIAISFMIILLYKKE